MAIGEQGLEGNDLLPVLSRATHQELHDLVTALNKGWDVFIRWDSRYGRLQSDFTKDPAFVEEYIIRAGRHVVADRFRRSPRRYIDIVRDACRGVGIKGQNDDLGVVELETLLLRALLDKVEATMSTIDRERLVQKIRETAGPDVSLADILTDGAKIASPLLPLIFAAIADVAIAQSLVGIGAIVASRATLSWLGPVGAVVGATWLVYDIAGPSLRATIPAVACVGLLRQRLIWGEAH